MAKVELNMVFPSKKSVLIELVRKKTPNYILRPTHSINLRRKLSLSQKSIVLFLTYIKR